MEMGQARVFATAEDFDRWLTEHHETATEIWVALPKKGTDAVSVTRAEVLDIVLCHGWIDGRAESKGTPDGWWSLRHTPRRRRSPWSKVNRTRAEELVREGRMLPAGLAEIERARADGRWAAAYDPPSTARVPDDLRAALDADPAAAAAFEALSRADSYGVLHDLMLVRRPETRERRIATFVARLAAGEPPKGRRS